jgi:hypothetical protein
MSWFRSPDHIFRDSVVKIPRAFWATCDEASQQDAERRTQDPGRAPRCKDRTTNLLDWRHVCVFDDRLEITQDLAIVQQRAVLRVEAIEPIWQRDQHGLSEIMNEASQTYRIDHGGGRRYVDCHCGFPSGTHAEGSQPDLRRST